MIRVRGTAAIVSAAPKRPPWKITPRMGQAAAIIQSAQGMIQARPARRAVLQGLVEAFRVALGQQGDQKGIGGHGGGLSHKTHRHLGNAPRVVQQADHAVPGQTAEDAQKLLIQHDDGLAQHQGQGRDQKSAHESVPPDRAQMQSARGRHPQRQGKGAQGRAHGDAQAIASHAVTVAPG